MADIVPIPTNIGNQNPPNPLNMLLPEKKFADIAYTKKRKKRLPMNSSANAAPLIFFFAILYH